MGRGVRCRLGVGWGGEGVRRVVGRGVGRGVEWGGGSGMGWEVGWGGVGRGSGVNHNDQHHPLF